MLASALLNRLDWAFIAVFFGITLLVGLWTSRRAGKTSAEFFLSGRDMPWWLLGVSMVATTFAIDTPNLVTGLVRNNGVAGNWAWWAFLLSGMLTVFVYAKLWRRANVMTDVEFYELRYSGRAAAFLRGFRALYLGLIFNVLVMGAVSLAAIKFGEIVLGIGAIPMLLGSSAVVLIYSSLGGLRGVILTDFVQFILAMIGSIWAAIFLVNHERVGGLDALLSNTSVIERMDMLPSFADPSQWVPLLLVPLAVQWWASYYPGSEPGGGGYIAQRMFSAKDERNAMGASLFFNVAHYALRPWPWIMIALASLVVFPTLDSIRTAFPDVDPSIIQHDIAYPAMLTLLPNGLLGLVAASLIGAFMSTMSTQVNLGASYLVNDLYKRFLKPEATERELVWAGRIATAVTLGLGSLMGLVLTDAEQAFKYLLLLGAGTGAIYILRWFWWRINAVTEIVAMTVSLIVATFFTFVYVDWIPADVSPEDKVWWNLAGTIIPVAITTCSWVLACFFTQPTSPETLRRFYTTVKPGGPGWKVVREEAQRDGIELDDGNDPWDVPLGILCTLMGCFTVYGAIFATGSWIYGRTLQAILFTVPTLILGIVLMRTWGRIRTSDSRA
ncbi:MAG: SSS family solute:Na+ symporter [Planctomycetota bacterium]|jgi:SSS family solute:Na+ symporter